MTMPIIKLNNGLLVGNFSSPHPFNFITGEVLPRCCPERVKKSELRTYEREHISVVNDISIKTIEISWALSIGCNQLLNEASDLFIDGKVDIVLIPLPVMQCIKDLHYRSEHIIKMPFRVVRCADRETKAIYSDRFCI